MCFIWCKRKQPACLVNVCYSALRLRLMREDEGAAENVLREPIILRAEPVPVDRVVAVLGDRVALDADLVLLPEEALHDRHGVHEGPRVLGGPPDLIAIVVVIVLVNSK